MGHVQMGPTTLEWDSSYKSDSYCSRTHDVGAGPKQGIEPITEIGLIVQEWDSSSRRDGTHCIGVGHIGYE